MRDFERSQSQPCTNGSLPVLTDGQHSDGIERRDAAEPFFRLAREIINPANGERPWHADSKDWMVVFSFAGQSLTLGDLRRAAAIDPQNTDGGASPSGGSGA